MKLIRAYLIVALLVPFYSYASAKCCPRWSASGELFLWRTNEDGLEYAKRAVLQPENTSTHVGQEQYFSQKMKYGLGSRLGVGYFLDSCTELKLTWTNYNSKGANSIFVDPEHIVLIPLVGYSALPFPIASANEFIVYDTNSADSNWVIHYNTLDFELNKTIHATSKIKVVPHGGLRWVWIDQKLNANYFYSGTTIIPVEPFTYLSSAHDQSKFTAGGLRVGVDTSMSIGWGFSVIAKAGGSLLYGRFKTSNETFVSTNLAGSPGNGFNDRFNAVRANVDGLFGIDWTLTLCNNRRISLAVSYEIVEWFNQNVFRTTGNGSYRNLGMQGVDFKVNFVF